MPVVVERWECGNRRSDFQGLGEGWENNFIVFPCFPPPVTSTACCAKRLTPVCSAPDTIPGCSRLAAFLRHRSPEAVRFIAGIDDVSLVR